MPTFRVRIEWHNTCFVDVEVEASNIDEAMAKAHEEANFEAQDVYDDGGDCYIGSIAEGKDGDLNAVASRDAVPIGHREQDLYLTPVEQHAEEMKALLEEIVGGGWNIMALPTPRARVAQLLAKIAAAK